MYSSLNSETLLYIVSKAVAKELIKTDEHLFLSFKIMQQKQGTCVQLHHCNSPQGRSSADSTLCHILPCLYCRSPSHDLYHKPCHDLDLCHSLDLEIFHSLYHHYNFDSDPADHDRNGLCPDLGYHGCHVHSDPCPVTCIHPCHDLCHPCLYHDHSHEPSPCNNLYHDQKDQVHHDALNLDFGVAHLCLIYHP